MTCTKKNLDSERVLQNNLEIYASHVCKRGKKKYNMNYVNSQGIQAKSHF